MKSDVLDWCRPHACPALQCHALFLKRVLSLRRSASTFYNTPCTSFADFSQMQQVQPPHSMLLVRRA